METFGSQYNVSHDCVMQRVRGTGTKTGRNLWGALKGHTFEATQRVITFTLKKESPFSKFNAFKDRDNVKKQLDLCGQLETVEKVAVTADTAANQIRHEDDTFIVMTSKQDDTTPTPTDVRKIAPKIFRECLLVGREDKYPGFLPDVLVLVGRNSKGLGLGSIDVHRIYAYQGRESLKATIRDDWVEINGHKFRVFDKIAQAKKAEEVWGTHARTASPITISWDKLMATTVHRVSERQYGGDGQAMHKLIHTFDDSGGKDWKKVPGPCLVVDSNGEPVVVADVPGELKRQLQTFKDSPNRNDSTLIKWSGDKLLIVSGPYAGLIANRDGEGTWTLIQQHDGNSLTQDKLNNIQKLDRMNQKDTPLLPYVYMRSNIIQYREAQKWNFSLTWGQLKHTFDSAVYSAVYVDIWNWLEEDWVWLPNKKVIVCYMAKDPQWRQYLGYCLQWSVEPTRDNTPDDATPFTFITNDIHTGLKTLIEDTRDNESKVTVELINLSRCQLFLEWAQNQLRDDTEQAEEQAPIHRMRTINHASTVPDLERSMFCKDTCKKEESYNSSTTPYIVMGDDLGVREKSTGRRAIYIIWIDDQGTLNITRQMNVHFPSLPLNATLSLAGTTYHETIPVDHQQFQKWVCLREYFNSEDAMRGHTTRSGEEDVHMFAKAEGLHCGLVTLSKTEYDGLERRYIHNKLDASPHLYLPRIMCKKLHWMKCFHSWNAFLREDGSGTTFTAVDTFEPTQLTPHDDKKTKEVYYWNHGLGGTTYHYCVRKCKDIHVADEDKAALETECTKDPQVAGPLADYISRYSSFGGDDVDCFIGTYVQPKPPALNDDNKKAYMEIKAYGDLRSVDEKSNKTHTLMGTTAGKPGEHQRGLREIAKVNTGLTDEHAVVNENSLPWLATKRPIQNKFQTYPKSTSFLVDDSATFTFIVTDQESLKLWYTHIRHWLAQPGHDDSLPTLVYGSADAVRHVEGTAQEAARRVQIEEAAAITGSVEEVPLPAEQADIDTCKALTDENVCNNHTAPKCVYDHTRLDGEKCIPVTGTQLSTLLADKKITTPFPPQKYKQWLQIHQKSIIQPQPSGMKVANFSWYTGKADELTTDLPRSLRIRAVKYTGEGAIESEFNNISTSRYAYLYIPFAQAVHVASIQQLKRIYTDTDLKFTKKDDSVSMVLMRAYVADAKHPELWYCIKKKEDVVGGSPTIKYNIGNLESDILKLWDTAAPPPPPDPGAVAPPAEKADIKSLLNYYYSPSSNAVNNLDTQISAVKRAEREKTNAKTEATTKEGEKDTAAGEVRTAQSKPTPDDASKEAKRQEIKRKIEAYETKKTAWEDAEARALEKKKAADEEKKKWTQGVKSTVMNLFSIKFVTTSNYDSSLMEEAMGKTNEGVDAPAADSEGGSAGDQPLVWIMEECVPGALGNNWVHVSHKFQAFYKALIQVKDVIDMPVELANTILSAAKFKDGFPNANQKDDESVFKPFNRFLCGYHDQAETGVVSNSCRSGPGANIGLAAKLSQFVKKVPDENKQDNYEKLFFGTNYVNRHRPKEDEHADRIEVSTKISEKEELTLCSDAIMAFSYRLVKTHWLVRGAGEYMDVTADASYWDNEGGQQLGAFSSTRWYAPPHQHIFFKPTTGSSEWLIADAQLKACYFPIRKDKNDEADSSGNVMVIGALSPQLTFEYCKVRGRSQVRNRRDQDGSAWRNQGGQSGTIGGDKWWGNQVEEVITLFKKVPTVGTKDNDKTKDQTPVQFPKCVRDAVVNLVSVTNSDLNEADFYTGGYVPKKTSTFILKALLQVQKKLPSKKDHHKGKEITGTRFHQYVNTLRNVSSDGVYIERVGIAGGYSQLSVQSYNIDMDYVIVADGKMSKRYTDPRRSLMEWIADTCKPYETNRHDVVRLLEKKLFTWKVSDETNKTPENRSTIGDKLVQYLKKKGYTSRRMKRGDNITNKLGYLVACLKSLLYQKFKTEFYATVGQAFWDPNITMGESETKETGSSLRLLAYLTDWIHQMDTNNQEDQFKKMCTWAGLKKHDLTKPFDNEVSLEIQGGEGQNSVSWTADQKAPKMAMVYKASVIIKDYCCMQDELDELLTNDSSLYVFRKLRYFLAGHRDNSGKTPTPYDRSIIYEFDYKAAKDSSLCLTISNTKWNATKDAMMTKVNTGKGVGSRAAQQYIKSIKDIGGYMIWLTSNDTTAYKGRSKEDEQRLRARSAQEDVAEEVFLEGGGSSRKATTKLLTKADIRRREKELGHRDLKLRRMYNDQIRQIRARRT